MLLERLRGRSGLKPKLALFAAGIGSLVAIALGVERHSSVDALAAILCCWATYFAGLAISISEAPYEIAPPSAPSRAAGSYELIERIAAGGMGEVWRARHASLVRPAAVKLIAARLLGQKTPEQLVAITRDFEREAQSTASLRSPHTVQLYDFGKMPDGSLYYVMELLGGLDLATFLEEFGAQPAERAIHILQQLCHSLAEAHRVGLIHRDIKPGNIQLTIHGGDFDFAKVLDFGLVKQRRRDRVSLDNAVRGTPGYLAPEAIRCRGPVDHRVDLYSIGCVAYCLLTGEHVFERASAPELMRAHLTELPIPPSRRTTLEIPIELERLVLELLSKDPTDRPASAAEVSRRLAEIPLVERWTQKRAELWWRENLPGATREALLESADETIDVRASLAPNLPRRASPDLCTVPDRPSAVARALVPAVLAATV